MGTARFRARRRRCVRLGAQDRPRSNRWGPPLVQARGGGARGIEGEGGGDEREGGGACAAGPKAGLVRAGGPPRLGGGGGGGEGAGGGRGGYESNAKGGVDGKT